LAAKKCKIHLKKYGFRKWPTGGKILNASGDIYEAVKLKGHRRLLYGSAPVTLMAQKVMQGQSYRFSKI
jgi:hypothetical protein